MPIRSSKPPWMALLLIEAVLAVIPARMRLAEGLDRHAHRSFEVVESPFDGGRSPSIGIAVRKDGVAFFASLRGIMMFDGEHWELFEHPQRQRCTAIACDANDRIYVGFHNDFGTLEFSPDGQGKFQSLRNACVEESFVTGPCSFVYAEENQVYFGCDFGVAIWKNDSPTMKGRFFKLPPKITAESFCFVHRHLIAAGHDTVDRKVSLMRFEEEKFVEFVSHKDVDEYPGFQNSFRIGGCEFDADAMLFATYLGGLFLIQEGKLVEFDTEISELAKKSRPKGLQRIDANTFLLCSQSGFTFFDKAGSILSGADNTNTSELGVCLNRGFVDHEQTVWIPTRGSGIAVKVDLSAKVLRWHTKSEITQWVARCSNTLWLSRADLLFGFPDRPTSKGKSVPAPNLQIPIGSSFEGIATSDVLLAGSIQGLRVVQADGTFETLAENCHLTAGVVFREETQAVFCSLGSGLQKFQKDGGTWKSLGLVAGSPLNCSSVVYDSHRDCLWYTSRQAGGDWQIERLKLANYDFQSDSVPKIERFPFCSFQQERNIVVWNGQVLFNVADGLLAYKDETNAFEPADLVGDSQIGIDRKDIGALAVDGGGNLWLTANPSQIYRIDKSGAVEMPRGLLASDNIRRIIPVQKSGKIWLINTRNDVIELDYKKSLSPTEIVTRIFAVANGASKKQLLPGGKYQFKYRSGPIQVSYSAHSANLHPSTQYQYRLLGLSPHWSNWTSESKQAFQALSPGFYEFQVQARSRTFTVGLPATFSFQVLPPWYATWWAIVMYTGFSFFALIVGANLQTIVQRRRLRQLEILVGERTSELEKSQQMLEYHVKDRTSQLEFTNRQLSLEIDRRREIELQLQESETRYRSIVDDQQEAIVRFDSYGNIEFANASFMRANQCKPESLSNANIFDYIHPDDLPRATQLFQNTTSEGLTTVAERLKVIRPDGRVEWEEWNGRAIYNAAGKFLCFQAASRNVTELVKAEDLIHEKETALRHVSRLSMLGEMVASITHEIHQPLGSISNFAFAVAKTLESQTDETAANIVRWNTQIVQQIGRAEEITRRLRGFARRSDTERLRLSVNVIVKDSLAMLEYDRRHAMVDVELNLCESLPDLELDRVQIEQVLVNLIRNAYDAMSTTKQGKRQLAIKTETIEQEVVVSVRDNGPGIEQDKLELIFQPFFTEKTNGLGLGLAISRSIIEDADGRIWAENMNPGLRMQFTLPIR